MTHITKQRLILSLRGSAKQSRHPSHAGLLRRRAFSQPGTDHQAGVTSLLRHRRDHLLERLDGIGPRQSLTVDEEGRRAAHAEANAFLKVGVDDRLVLAAVQAVSERACVQSQLRGVSLEHIGRARVA